MVVTIPGEDQQQGADMYYCRSYITENLEIHHNQNKDSDEEDNAESSEETQLQQLTGELNRNMQNWFISTKQVGYVHSGIVLDLANFLSPSQMKQW